MPLPAVSAIGFVVLTGLAWLCSGNRRATAWRPSPSRRQKPAECLLAKYWAPDTNALRGYEDMRMVCFASHAKVGPMLHGSGNR